jgi:hypothetical protein
LAGDETTLEARDGPCDDADDDEIPKRRDVTVAVSVDVLCSSSPSFWDAEVRFISLSSPGISLFMVEVAEMDPLLRLVLWLAALACGMALASAESNDISIRAFNAGETPFDPRTESLSALWGM